MSDAKIAGGSVFERYEEKYLLTEPQYQGLMAKLLEHMQQDRYGRHTICTVYYDTDDYAIIRRCLEKPKFKEKLRLRSYGVPQADDTVYLELKKKLAGVTYKRRVSLALCEAQDYLEKHLQPAEQGQIFREIDWFASQLPLKPRALVCYDRVALFGREDPNLRVTFDTNVRWRDHHLSLVEGDDGALLLAPGTSLMEIKTLRALPLWLVQALSQYRIYPTSFSKYGTIYQEHLA